MLHCLRNESYRRPQQQAEAQVDGPGLRPLLVDSPMQEDHPMPSDQKAKANRKKYRTGVSRADFCLTSGIRLTLHGCDVKTLVSMIKEIEDSLC